MLFVSEFVELFFEGGYHDLLLALLELLDSGAGHSLFVNYIKLIYITKKENKKNGHRKGRKIREKC